jgi:hypothetical protein
MFPARLESDSQPFRLTTAWTPSIITGSVSGATGLHLGSGGLANARNPSIVMLVGSATEAPTSRIR